MSSHRTVPSFDSFAATVVSYDDAPDECTIYPRNLDEADRRTAWITAKEDSFCSSRSQA